MHKSFEWDYRKNKLNIKKHKISFYEAQKAFIDNNRIVAEDHKHSQKEIRKYCIGKVNNKVITVRYTIRGNKIRIFGAGHWSLGNKIYVKKNTNR